MSIPKLLEYIPIIIKKLWEYFKKLPALFVEVGGNLIKGLWDGIKNVSTWLWNKIKEFTGQVMDKVKNFFGIKSPSKEFAIVGKYNVEGLEEGMLAEKQGLNKTIKATFGDGLNYVANMGLNGSNYANIGNSSSQPIVINSIVQAKVNEGILFDASQRINYNKNLQTGFGG